MVRSIDAGAIESHGGSIEATTRDKARRSGPRVSINNVLEQ
jgi:hypothetical protein